MSRSCTRTRLDLEHLEPRDTPAVADIAVEKTDGLAAMREGSSTTYTIRVTNNGPDAVSNVTIDDPFPITPFNSKNWTATGINGATINQTAGTGPLTVLANMPVGGVVQITASLFVFPRTGGTLVNTVTATLAAGDTDPNPANNSATDRTDVGAAVIPDGPGGTLYAVGSDRGVPGVVKAYLSGSGELVHTIAPFGAFNGGVRVATGDVTGDGWDDIVVGAGPGATPHVKVFDGRSGQEVASFLAFDAGFTGGVFVAAARLNAAQGAAGQIVVGTDAGATPHVKVFDGLMGAVLQGSPLGSFFAYDTSFAGGVRVAAGDLDGLPGDEIVTATGAGARAHVKTFGASGALTASFFAFDPTFLGGAFVAVRGASGSGGPAVVVSAGTTAPHVKVFDPTGTAERASFFAFEGFTGGARVTVGNRDRDAHPDLIVAAGPGGGPHVKAFSGFDLSQLDSFFALDPSFGGGVFVG